MARAAVGADTGVAAVIREAAPAGRNMEEIIMCVCVCVVYSILSGGQKLFWCNSSPGRVLLLLLLVILIISDRIK